MQAFQSCRELHRWRVMPVRLRRALCRPAVLLPSAKRRPGDIFRPQPAAVTAPQPPTPVQLQMQRLARLAAKPTASAEPAAVPGTDSKPNGACVSDAATPLSVGVRRFEQNTMRACTVDINVFQGSGLRGHARIAPSAFSVEPITRLERDCCTQETP